MSDRAALCVKDLLSWLNALRTSVLGLQWYPTPAPGEPPHPPGTRTVAFFKEEIEVVVRTDARVHGYTDDAEDLLLAYVLSTIRLNGMTLDEFDAHLRDMQRRVG